MITPRAGSDYQALSITLDAGHARDIMLMLPDVCAVPGHIYLDGTRPQATSPGPGLAARVRQPLHPARAHRRPRRSDQPALPGRMPGIPLHPSRHDRRRPCSLPRLLTIPPGGHRPGGAKSQENYHTPHHSGWGQIKGAQRVQSRLTKPIGRAEHAMVVFDWCSPSVAKVRVS
jgi:hypothetical protein